MKRSTITNSSTHKSLQKGKSLTTIQQSQLKNINKNYSKITMKQSKISKTNSLIKIHQPLSIQQRFLNDKTKQSKNNQSLKQPYINSVNSSRNKINQSRNNNNIQLMKQSRQKIHQHLQNKRSYLNPDKLTSFRQTGDLQIMKQTQKTKQKPQSTTLKSSQSMLKEENKRLIQENKQLRQKYLQIQGASLEDKEKIKTLISRVSELKRNHQELEGSQYSQNNRQNNLQIQNKSMVKSKVTASYAQMMKDREKITRNPTISERQNISVNQTPFRMLYPVASGNKSNSQCNNMSKNKQQYSCGSVQCEERRKYLQGELYRERIKRDELEEEKREWEITREKLKKQYQDLLFEVHNLREDGLGDNEGEE